MHIIIVGSGKIGLSLAETLAAHKHDVVIIDINKEKCQEIADDFNGVVINGDANDVEVLKEAGIGNSDIFVAVTSNEEVNLFSCLIAKDLAKIKTVARVTKPNYEKLFRKAGVDIVVSPEAALASRLENMIIEPDVVDIAMIHRGDVEMLEFTIHHNSKINGKTIKDLERPKGALIVAVKDEDNFVIPDAHTILKPDDHVIVIVKKKMEKDIRKMFV